jgi:hypothetical protein
MEWDGMGTIYMKVIVNKIFLVENTVFVNVCKVNSSSLFELNSALGFLSTQDMS